MTQIIRKCPPRGPKWRARKTQVPRFLIWFIAFWAICLLPLAASLHCSLYTSLAFSIISCLFFTPKKHLFFKQVCAAALYVRAPFWAIFRRQKNIISLGVFFACRYWPFAFLGHFSCASGGSLRALSYSKFFDFTWQLVRVYPASSSRLPRVFAASSAGAGFLSRNGVPISNSEPTFSAPEPR